MTFEIKFPLKREGIEQAIQSWWDVFKASEDKINTLFSGEGDNEFDIVKFMGEHLDKVNPDMSWEFGPGTSKPHLLAIAPERARSLDPLARMIVDLAPADLKYFNIRLHRPVVEWDAYKQFTDGRLSWKSPEGIHFTAEPGEHNLINLVFYTKPEHQDHRTFDNCYIMMESLLGEHVVQDWIGFVDVEESKAKGLFGRGKSKFPDTAQPVSKLREAVASEIAKVKNGLPKQPYYKFSENGKWSLMEMSPSEGDDFPRMNDLFTMVALAEGPSASLYTGQKRFASDRFSAHSETFVFVKLDGSADDLNMEIFEDRGGIEDALSESLLKAELGGVIGGGTGSRYSYVFLALTDLDNAIPVIREALQNGRMTKRSWIMFNDTYREQEWIGVWDDTPEPLLPEIDSQTD